MGNWFWCYFRQLFVSLAILENATKDFEILNIILVQDFCPLKIDIVRPACLSLAPLIHNTMKTFEKCRLTLFLIGADKDVLVRPVTKILFYFYFPHLKAQKIVFSFFYLTKFKAVILSKVYELKILQM